MHCGIVRIANDLLMNRLVIYLYFTVPVYEKITIIYLLFYLHYIELGVYFYTLLHDNVTYQEPDTACVCTLQIIPEI